MHHSYIFYPSFAYYFLPSTLVTPATFSFIYYKQVEVKVQMIEVRKKATQAIASFQNIKVFDRKLFDPDTFGMTTSEPAFVIWLGVICLGIFSYLFISITVATWTLATLMNMENMSQKTKMIQKRLTISLSIQVGYTRVSITAVQTAFYDIFFVGIAATILLLTVTGNGRTSDENTNKKENLSFSSYECHLLCLFPGLHKQLCSTRRNH